MRFDVIVPQLGEGLQEVRIVRLFKGAGDTVARDEPLFEMETDKALVQVESACGGRFAQWLVREGDVVRIGATVAHIDRAAAAETAAATPSSSPPATDDDSLADAGAAPRIPPRTRAYCRQLGIAPALMARIPAHTSRLLPDDVDRWRAGGHSAPPTDASRQMPERPDAVPSAETPFVLRPLSSTQRALNRRFARSAAQVVPATLRRLLPWSLVEARLGHLRAQWPEAPLSPLVAIAHAAAQAAAAHPRLRSAIAGEDSLRESRHLTLGVAVEGPDDELVTAAIEHADTLDAGALAEAMRRRIARARDGEDQSTIAPHLLLTDLTAHGITDAVPVLVAPAAAVLFIGAPFGDDDAPNVNLALTFDHRLTNGAGAARFLDTIVERLADSERSARPLDRRRLGGGGQPGAETVDETGPFASGPETLTTRVRARVAGLLGVAHDTIDPRRPLRAYGLTSLVAVEIARRLGEDHDLQLPVTLVWNQPTLEQVTRYIAQRSAPVVDRDTRGAATATAVATGGVNGTRSNGRAEHEPIAVIGLGCRFPGADSPAAFWRLMADGRHGIREVPRERWDIDAVYDPRPGVQGRMITRAGGFLDCVDHFDHSFFGISQREAAGMDPQQRLLLEVTWEALEHAGVAAHRLAGSNTSVFVGSCFNDYFTLLARAPGRGGSGTLTSILANRVSYFLDLRGPSLVVDTACSSSLVAVDLACRSLRDGTSSLALAGGVNVILSPRMHLTFSQAGMMAPDGNCKTFDARADGYGRSEGCGVVVLKRLSDARAAGDRVLAIIRGSAVNQDGATNGISAPNGLAQQAVIRQALANAGVDASAISLVEAHGTGTSLGDSIEVEALRTVYGGLRADGEICVLGSVKTNVGHLEAAAGVAGLLKLVLCLQHEATPPHVHFQSPNPHLPLAGTPFVISTELRRWARGERPRFASVSSFGVGGTNAHAILEEPPPEGPMAAPERDGYILPLSARSDKALAELIDRYRALLDSSTPSLGEICRAAGVGRSHFSVRLAITCRTIDQLRDRLGLAANGVEGEGLYRGTRVGHAALPVDGESSSLPLDSAAALYARGVDLDWAAFDPHARPRPELPTYPFQRRRCWLEPEELLEWRVSEVPR